MRHLLTVCLTTFAILLPVAAQSTELAGVRPALERTMKVLRADGAGLTVFRGSRELHRSLHGTFAADQVIPIGAASEWLTVATIMSLVDDGTLELHHPVARYVQEFDSDARRRLTLRQCMACTSGLPEEMNSRMRRWDMQRFAEQAARVGLRTQPGTAFDYGHVGFQVAALCAVRATGKPWHQLFRERIGDPLGMRDTHFGAFYPLADDPGTTALPWAASGAVSTLNDYTRFVRMLLADGHWHGEQLLSKDRIDEMLRDQVRRRVDVRAPGGEPKDVRYGLGTWIERDGADVVRFSDAGAFGFTPWISGDRTFGGVFAVKDRGDVVRRQLRSVHEKIEQAVESPAVTGTSEIVTLRHDGRERRFHLFVPPGDQGVEALPLLMVLHAGGSSADEARAVTRLDRLGVEKGFVVVFPDGTGTVASRKLTWNAGGADVYASRNDVDDVGFCKAVVAEVQQRVAIDSKRVFVTGHDNGGMMCHRLAREAADLFEGIAPVAAAMNYSEAQSNVPLAVLMIHGAADEYVRLEGGPGAAPRGGKARVDASMQQAIDYYVARNGLLAYPDTAERGGVEVQRFFRKKGDGEAPPVWVVTLEGGSHAWPGAHKRPRELQKRPFGWPASQAVLEFFDSVGTGLLQEQLTPSVPR